MTEPKKKRRSSRPRHPEHEREEGAYTVVLRNQALVLTYRRLAFAALMAVAAAIVSLVVFLGVHGKPVPPQYLPITKDGRLLPLIPLGRANVDDGVIGEFALTVFRDLNTYDYLNWQTQILSVQDKFMPDQWSVFMDEFRGSNILNTVKARKMIVVGRPAGAVSIDNQGLNNGVWTWRVSLPVRIQYIAHVSDSAGRDASLGSEGIVTVYIKRVPPTLNPSGYAVYAYLYEQRPLD